MPARSMFCPRSHGSAFFTRGETQAIGAVTLGSTRDAQIIDALEGERRDPFMLHYNFPPYSVGRGGAYRLLPAGVRSVTAASRAAVSPLCCLANEEFPYTIRVVSEITESNGSSSMASVCAGSWLDGCWCPLEGSCSRIAMGSSEREAISLLS